MKINGTEYIWRKTFESDPKGHGHFYEIVCVDNKDYERMSISFVVNMFSGAVAILDDLKTWITIEDNLDNVLNDILTNLQENKEYTHPEHDRYTYYIKEINFWKVVKA